MFRVLVIASVIGVISASWPWDTVKGNRDSAPLDDAPPSSSADFMDSYIKESGSQVADAAGTTDSAVPAGSGGMQDLWTKDLDADQTSAKKEPTHLERAIDSSTADAPVVQSTADAPVVQSQVQSSVSGASATNQVVDVRLSSELQTLQSSFLQARNVELKKLGSFRSATAPDVEAEVAKQRQFDIYIHDGFGDAAAEDVKKEKEVNADKNLKP